MNVEEGGNEFENWLKSIPSVVSSDPLWKMHTYRQALYLSDVAWDDCGKLKSDHRGKAISQQLIRSAGSIPANIEEGYGRGYGKDYARFLRIAIGSCRETKGWYFRARHTLSEKLIEERITLINNIISALVKIERNQRRN